MLRSFDRNKSHIFDNEPLPNQPQRVNRMSSNIFFSDYVPSTTQDVKRKDAKQQEPLVVKVEAFESKPVEKRDAFKSTIFDLDNTPSRGNRRHYGGKYHSDIFHRREEAPKFIRDSSREQFVASKSSSFSNIFGDAQVVQQPPQEIVYDYQRSGLASNEANRESRGKRRNEHYQSQIFF